MKNRRLNRLAIFATALLCIGSFNTAYAKHTKEKIKDAIDDAASSLKKGVEQIGENLSAIQDYLDKYEWRGMVQDEVISDPATLKHLQLNGHSRAVVAKPGERIECLVECSLDPLKCSPLHLYRVVVGIKGEGAQTTIANEFGLAARETLERFDLIAPAKPGVYEVRFKVVEAAFERSAIDAWKDAKGREPDATKTIGVIIVK